MDPLRVARGGGRLASSSAACGGGGELEASGEMTEVRIELSRYEFGSVVVFVRHAEAKQYVDAPPCPHCEGVGHFGGFGTGREFERCEPCSATGIDPSARREP